MQPRSYALTFLLATALLPTVVGASSSNDAEGLLYGRVTTRDGATYEGRLRWDNEEASWGDFFNSGKADNPWVTQAPRQELAARKRTIQVFGLEVGIPGDFDDSRQFVARFGDIARLDLRGGDDLDVVLKGGTRIEVEGDSNDVEAKVTVYDESLGEIAVDWSRIRSVEFLAVPAGRQVDELRLYGTVATTEGDFTGFVQWDQDEALGSDELNGETEDGTVKLPLRTVASIEKRTSRSSSVVLRDGRTLVVSGTNDVDSDNRGIYVDDARFGRVLVSWDAFKRASFSAAGSGPGYAEFPAGQHLAGTVTTVDGRKLHGRLVYDLDESETTEMLDGSRRDIAYSIPFALVAAVAPRGDTSRVVLRSGVELVLEESADVGQENAGILVFATEKGKPTYVRWEDVERVDFTAPAKSWPPVRAVQAERAP